VLCWMRQPSYILISPESMRTGTATSRMRSGVTMRLIIPSSRPSRRPAFSMRETTLSHGLYSWACASSGRVTTLSPAFLLSENAVVPATSVGHEACDKDQVRKALRYGDKVPEKVEGHDEDSNDARLLGGFKKAAHDVTDMERPVWTWSGWPKPTALIARR